MTEQGGHLMPARVAKITLICTYEPCQTPFEVLPSRVGRAKYCSKRCHMLANNAQIPMTLAERFWEKVLKGSPQTCWLWQGGKTGRGYGVMRVPEQKRNVGAHVISWYLFHGTWPPEGMDVLHNCPGGDQPGCCNPTHLWVGTHQDNMLDKVAKSRDNTPRKVTKEQALEMCELYATGEWTYKQLAKRYGLAERTPHWIIKQYNTHTLPSLRERAARGERIGKATITDAQWQEALDLHTSGWGAGRLAKRYGVNKSAIRSRLKHQL
jgi:transposase-like protein